MDRRSFLCAALGLIPAASALGQTTTPVAGEFSVEQVLDRAEALSPHETVVVARNGSILAERSYRGHSVSVPTNIKSASKSVISALVGIAIDRGLLEGAGSTNCPALELRSPAGARPAAARDHDRLSALHAGRPGSYVRGQLRKVDCKSQLVGAALAQPFVDEPGGSMLYSTGSTHLLSAILTRVGRRTTLALARDWLGSVPGFAISDWEQDPQGTYLGGNQMAMSPRSLLAFGELYRNRGRTPDGRQVVPESWIELSWQPRTQSRFTGDAYGYGWFLRRMGEHDVRYGWGYGGQMLYIVPDLGLTVTTTSDDRQPSGRTGYRDELHELLASIIAVTSRNPKD